MTVWCFGDSYIDPPMYKKKYPDQYDDQYYNLVAKELSTTAQSFGAGGSGLDFIFDQFHTNRHKINSGDTIIMALTNLSRRWFFKDHPNRSYIRLNPNKSDVNKALKQYTLYLDNEIIYNHYLLNFLYNINLFSKRNNVTVIGLYCFLDVQLFVDEFKHEFSNITFSKGSLGDISRCEYDTTVFSNDELINSILPNDARVNHLSRTNHKILAKKIIANLVNNEEIDLYTEFKLNFLNKENLYDAEFNNYESFDNECINFLLGDNMNSPYNFNNRLKDI